MAFELCLEEWDGLSGGHRGGEAESHLRAESSQSVWACVRCLWDQLAGWLKASSRRLPMPGHRVYS